MCCSQTYMTILLHRFLLTFFSFFLVYIGRLASNPQWVYCNGCELESIDAALLLGISVFALSCSAVANRGFFRCKRSKRDPLMIINECMLGWHLGGALYNLAYVLFLIDPNGVYFVQGAFNWRMFTLFATCVLFHVQTAHQVLVSRIRKRKVLLQATDLSLLERFNEVLEDRQLRGELTKFLEGELSAETLLFLDAVEEYKKSGVTQQKGQLIVTNFILRGSPNEVNISSVTRSQLSTVSVFDERTFDVSFSEVKDNFLRDGFSRFLTRLARQDALSKPRKTVRKSKEAKTTSQISAASV